MSEDSSSSPSSKAAAPAPRIVEATHSRAKESLGPIEIIGSTKHGPTALISVKDGDTLRDGDTLKTKVYILNAREFVVVKKHSKPMTLPGVWYEVRGIATPVAKPGRR